MSFINTSVSAIGKLISVVLLLIAFVGAMTAVVVMSLSGEEIKVPEITGKDFSRAKKSLRASASR